MMKKRKVNLNNLQTQYNSSLNQKQGAGMSDAFPYAAANEEEDPNNVTIPYMEHLPLQVPQSLHRNIHDGFSPSKIIMDPGTPVTVHRNFTNMTSPRRKYQESFGSSIKQDSRESDVTKRDQIYARFNQVFGNKEHSESTNTANAMKVQVLIEEEESQSKKQVSNGAPRPRIQINQNQLFGPSMKSPIASPLSSESSNNSVLDKPKGKQPHESADENHERKALQQYTNTIQDYIKKSLSFMFKDDNDENSQPNILEETKQAEDKFNPNQQEEATLMNKLQSTFTDFFRSNMEAKQEELTLQSESVKEIQQQPQTPSQIVNQTQQSPAKEWYLSPEEVLDNYSALLSPQEKQEVRKYEKIFFLGTDKSKEQARLGKLLSRPFGLSRNGHRKTNYNGLYRVIEGDQIAYRYQVIKECGRGAFGQVLKCLDHCTDKIVAVKLIRNDMSLAKAARIEEQVLGLITEEQRKLQGNNPQAKSLIQMIDHFKFRGHFCFVFDFLGPNLYQVMLDQKDRLSKSQKMSFIKSVTQQIVEGLTLLSRLGILHSDLKPENILMATEKPEETKVQIIDFGSASFLGSPLYTYVQSRYYRAPEVLLGSPMYNQQIDMFSLGCIIAELYISYPLFPAQDENELLEFHTQILGPIPPYMIEDSQKFGQLFIVDLDGNIKVRRSKNSRLDKVQSLNLLSIETIIFQEKIDRSERVTEDEKMMLDFIERCLIIDPTNRMTSEEALLHQWLQEGQSDEGDISHGTHLGNQQESSLVAQLFSPSNLNSLFNLSFSKKSAAQGGSSNQSQGPGA